MRGNIALVSLLAAGLLVGAGPATGEPVAPSAAELPQEVDGGVIVDLADGDRFKATVSRDLRTVWGSRYEADTGVWGQRTVVLREKNVYCGDVDARAAGNAVALIAECDKGGYSEDQAPTHSQALYSPDTLTWQTFTLPGEAYDEPGISPGGTAAIWPLYHGWATYTPAGFEVVERELPGQEYTITGTISDTGDVSILYGDGQIDFRDCVLSVLTVAATGAESEQHLDVQNACADVELANVDANTVVFGFIDYPESTVTLSRPDTASPWAITGIAPLNAPGLVRHRGRGTAPTLFASSPGLPLLAVGSPDKKSFYAQAYDPLTQQWSAPETIRSGSPTCTWGDNFIQEPLDVFALRLKCGTKQRVLISVDGTSWTNVPLFGRQLGVAPDGAQVSVSWKNRTLIFSRELGEASLPVGGNARCDVVQPVSPESAIRLTTSSKRGWPSRLELSTSSGWKRTSTEFPRLHVANDVCRHVRPELSERPVNYSFLGRSRVVSLAVVPHGDAFKIKRTVY